MVSDPVIVITGASRSGDPPPPQATRKTHIAELKPNSLNVSVTQSPTKYQKRITQNLNTMFRFYY